MKPVVQPSLEQPRRYFAQFGSVVPRECGPLLEIVDWIEREKLAATLYIAASLDGLAVSDRLHSSSADHVLNIRAHGSEFVFFEYHHTRGASDGMRKTVRYAEVVEVFRQFLAYKFGIHRPHPKEEPNQLLRVTDQDKASGGEAMGERLVFPGQGDEIAGVVVGGPGHTSRGGRKGSGLTLHPGGERG